MWLRRHEAHGDGPGKRSRRGPWDSSGQCGRPTCTRGPARTSLGDMAPAAGARHAGVPPVCHRCARGATRRSVAQGSSARHGRTARGRPLSACTTHFTPCDMATLCGSPRHRRSSGGRRVRWPLSLGGCTLMPMARWRRAWGTATRTGVRGQTTWGAAGGRPLSALAVTGRRGGARGLPEDADEHGDLTGKRELQAPRPSARRLSLPVLENPGSAWATHRSGSGQPPRLSSARDLIAPGHRNTCRRSF